MSLQLVVEQRATEQVAKFGFSSEDVRQAKIALAYWQQRKDFSNVAKSKDLIKKMQDCMADKCKQPSMRRDWLANQLNLMFPYARFKDVVFYRGKKFQIDQKSPNSFVLDWREVPSETQTTVYHWRGEIKLVLTKDTHRCKCCKWTIPQDSLVFYFNGYDILDPLVWNGFSKGFWLCERCTEKWRKIYPKPFGDLKRRMKLEWQGDVCSVLKLPNPINKLAA